MRFYRVLLSAIAVCLFASCSKSKPEEPITQRANDKVVVAYLPTWKMPYTPDWEKITHLCLAFGTVGADGSLNMSAIRQTQSHIVREAHKNNVKVLLSIGGGGTQNFSNAILTDATREKLVTNIVRAIEEFGFDGVDIDYEEWDGGMGGASAPDIARRTALESLYKEVRERVGNNKLITAAVTASYDKNEGGWGFYNCFNNTMHQYLDFVSLMIYDETGPWSGEVVGAHSDWEFFENSINYWLNKRNIPKKKLVAGVPFYGYLFKSANSAAGAEGVPYKDIIKTYPDAYLSDNIGLLYYDGVPTIRRKANYIMDNNLGGIMFWEITQDTDLPSKSLLGAIDEILNPQQ